MFFTFGIKYSQNIFGVHLGHTTLTNPLPKMTNKKIKCVYVSNTSLFGGEIMRKNKKLIY